MLRTLAYSFFIFALWALFGRWYYVCHIRGCATCCNEISTTVALPPSKVSEEPPVPPSPPDNNKGTQGTFLDMTIKDGNFPFNSATFVPKPDFVEKATQLLDYSKQHPKAVINITGHTDNIGSDPYNIKLGLQRAESVKKYLSEKGVRIAMLTDSKGESIPISTNDTEEGRAQNRRVNCKVTAQ
jgi:outer membrane protein OmpA-like peptidoglycan-associated protein